MSESGARALADLVEAARGDAGSPFFIGTVTAVRTTTASVQPDGSAVVMADMPVSGQLPSVGDRVLVLKVGGTGVVFRIGAASGGGGLTLIQDVLLGAPASSVVFASIPQTFRHLRIVVNMQVDVSGSATYAQFNDDAVGSHYLMEELESVNTVITANEVIDLGIIVGGDFSNEPLYGAAGVADIIDYTNPSFYRTVVSQIQGRVTNPSPRIASSRITGYWRNAANPITKITLTNTVGGNFIAGSRASLYGY